MSVIENTSVIVTAIGEIFRNLTTKRVIFWTLYLMTTIIIAGLVYDYFYNNTEYTKAERKIELLLRVKEKSANQELTDTVDSLLTETIKSLDKQERTKIQFNVDTLLKLGASFFIPLLISLASFRRSDFSNVLVGSIFIGSVTFGGAYFVPTLYNIWINIGLVVLIQTLFLFWLARKTGNL